jgi:hypothetical protein
MEITIDNFRTILFDDFINRSEIKLSPVDKQRILEFSFNVYMLGRKNREEEIITKINNFIKL